MSFIIITSHNVVDKFILTLLEISVLLGATEENIINCSLNRKAQVFFLNLIIERTLAVHWLVS